MTRRRGETEIGWQGDRGLMRWGEGDGEIVYGHEARLRAEMLYNGVQARSRYFLEIVQGKGYGYEARFV